MLESIRKEPLQEWVLKIPYRTSSKVQDNIQKELRYH
jgi:hypothetical protein